MRGGRIKIPLKAGHDWPASKMPFKYLLIFFTGSGSVLPRNPIFL